MVCTGGTTEAGCRHGVRTISGRCTQYSTYSPNFMTQIKELEEKSQNMYMNRLTSFKLLNQKTWFGALHHGRFAVYGQKLMCHFHLMIFIRLRLGLPTKVHKFFCCKNSFRCYGDLWLFNLWRTWVCQQKKRSNSLSGTK